MKTTNEIIKEALTELKERRDWKSQWEVEIWFENKLREVEKEARKQERERINKLND